MTLSPKQWKVLEVDLTTQRVQVKDLDPAITRNYLGSMGLNIRAIYDLIKPGIDPLSPDNVVSISPGLLNGTLAPGSPKTGIMAKSPLSNTLGTAITGHFGYSLKLAGYDQLIIKGKAEKPVYLKIFDDNVEICDAGSIWGKDITETTDHLFQKYRPAETVVAAIGPAGEKMVRFALILINKISTWGRGGLGAVWGSKNLKAIVVNGTRDRTVYDPKAFNDLIKTAMEKFQTDRSKDQWRLYGTMLSWPLYAQMGNFSIKHGQEAFPPEEAVRLFGPETYVKEVKKGPRACPSCPVSCKASLQIKNGEFQGLETLTSCNLGGAMSYGIQCQVGNYNRVVKCHDLANRYGLDSASLGSFIDFLVEMREIGKIGAKDLGGLSLEHGFETTAELMRLVTNREGIGDIVADGWGRIFDWLGKEMEEYSLQIRGVSPPFEARTNLGTENLGIYTCPRGAHPTETALSPTVVPGRKPEDIRKYCTQTMGVPDHLLSGITPPNPPGRYPGVHVGRFLPYVENYNLVLSALGICSRPPINRLYNIDICRDYLAAAEGINLSREELSKVGERIFTLATMFNVREGITRENLKIPKKWLTQKLLLPQQEIDPLDEGLIKTLLDDYYLERGWEPQKGIPTEEKMRELNINVVY